MDVAELQAQLAELKKAYWSGARSIQYEGKSVAYASGEEMRAAIASLAGRPRITFEENAGLAEVLPIDYVNAAITTFRKLQGWPDPTPKPAAN